MLGDTTLTEKQVTQLGQELQWERAKIQRETVRQKQAQAKHEEKVNRTLESQKIMEVARQAGAIDLRNARAESLSTMAVISQTPVKLYMK